MGPHRISEFAARTGVSAGTLRHYEREGGSPFAPSTRPSTTVVPC